MEWGTKDGALIEMSAYRIEQDGTGGRRMGNKVGGKTWKRSHNRKVDQDEM